MKILLVTQYFWPENFRINEMSLELKERGHEVTVLTGLPNYPSGKIFKGYGPFEKFKKFKNFKENYKGIEIIRFPHFPRGNCGFLGMSANFISFALFGSMFAPFLLKGKKFDVIFVYEPSPVTVGFPALVMKYLCKIPLVFWVQDLWPESLTSAGGIKSPFILKPVDAMVRFLYKRFDKILTQSKSFMPSVISHGANPKRVEYFPQSAEPNFKPLIIPDNANERNLIPKGFIILFAGNIGVSQDFPTILAAAEMTKDFQDMQWVILGDGRMAAYVKDEIKRRGLQKTVHLLGRYPVESMPKFFSLSDILLLTFKNGFIYQSTIPTKLQAYMACGKAILAGIDGEAANIIKEAGCGLAVEPENPAALAESAIKLYNMSKEEINKMGLNGLKYSNEHFNAEKLMDKLEKILSDTEYQT